MTKFRIKITYTMTDIMEVESASFADAIRDVYQDGVTVDQIIGDTETIMVEAVDKFERGN